MRTELVNTSPPRSQLPLRTICDVVQEENNRAHGWKETDRRKSARRPRTSRPRGHDLVFVVPYLGGLTGRGSRLTSTTCAWGKEVTLETPHVDETEGLNGHPAPRCGHRH